MTFGTTLREHRTMAVLYRYKLIANANMAIRIK